MSRFDFGVWRERLASMHWLWLALALFGLAWGGFFRPFFLSLGGYGLYRLIAHARSTWRDGRVRFLTALFCCLWLPMVVSAVDAVDPGRAFGTVIRYLLFGLAGLAVLSWNWTDAARRRLSQAFIAVMVFWVADGLWQAVAGANLFGFPPYNDQRLTGMFSPYPRLGPVLAILSPLFFDWVVRLNVRWPGAWLLLLPYLGAILLGGSRSSLVVLVMGMVLYAGFRARTLFADWRGWMLPMLIVTGLAIGLLWRVDWVAERYGQFADLFGGDYEQANMATSLRLPLWQAALGMFLDHGFNGVGVRNFAIVFHQCCYHPGEGMPPFSDGVLGHPHLFVAEIASETGSFGLLGYGLLLFLMLRALRADMDKPALPWGLSALLAAFPLSSSLSFYAIFSSALLWLLLLGWLVQRHRGIV